MFYSYLNRFRITPSNKHARTQNVYACTMGIEKIKINLKHIQLLCARRCVTCVVIYIILLKKKVRIYLIKFSLLVLLLSDNNGYSIF